MQKHGQKSANAEQNDPGGGKLVLTNAKGDQTPLNMEWVDVNEVEELSFTKVRSRKKRERKSIVVIERPTTRSQKNGVSSKNETESSTQPPSKAFGKGGRNKKK